MFALGLSRETLKDNEMDMKFPTDLPQLHANFPCSLNLDFYPEPALGIILPNTSLLVPYLCSNSCAFPALVFNYKLLGAGGLSLSHSE